MRSTYVARSYRAFPPLALLHATILAGSLGASACQQYIPQPALPANDPDVVACRGGNSHVCNEIGERYTGKGDHRQARGYYKIACDRLRSSLQQTALRVVVLRDEAALSSAKSEELRQADERDIDNGTYDHNKRAATREELSQANDLLMDEGDEYVERMTGCVNIGDSFFADDSPSAAVPYYDSVCAFKQIQPSINFFRVLYDIQIDAGCAGGDDARAAARLASRSRVNLANALLQGTQTIGNSISTGSAQLAAARRGEIVYPSASPPAATEFGVTSEPSFETSSMGGSCADYGKSCEQDGAFLSWNQRCHGSPPAQAACYCAAAATYACFLAHGCYAEAGARRADGQPSDTHQAELQDGRSRSRAQAADLGTTCTP